MWRELCGGPSADRSGLPGGAQSCQKLAASAGGDIVSGGASCGAQVSGVQPRLGRPTHPHSHVNCGSQLAAVMAAGDGGGGGGAELTVAALRGTSLAVLPPSTSLPSGVLAWRLLPLYFTHVQQVRRPRDAATCTASAGAAYAFVPAACLSLVSLPKPQCSLPHAPCPALPCPTLCFRRRPSLPPCPLLWPFTWSEASSRHATQVGDTRQRSACSAACGAARHLQCRSAHGGMLPERLVGFAMHCCARWAATTLLAVAGT